MPFWAALLPTPNLPSRPTPRSPDGKPRLGPTSGEKGYWGRPSSTVLMETGANVQMNAYGLLRNIADVDKVAPFQKWARDLYEYRQRNFLKDDPLFIFCKPPGPLRQFQMPYGIQFLEDKNFARIFLVEGGGNHNWHFIYTDGRPQTGEARGNADNPLYYGRSVAKWEGDTLVVDTIGQTTKTFVDIYRTPHTEKLHVVERWRMVDGGQAMEVTFTIDDPGAFYQPWTGMRHYRRVKQEWGEKICAENNSFNLFDYHVPTAQGADF
jgi:hypothetical protein